MSMAKKTKEGKWTYHAPLNRTTTLKPAPAEKRVYKKKKSAAKA